MALNLVRNSRVFFTTNLDSSDKVAATSFTTSNTFEIQVLDGFTFSQTTNNETVMSMEAGSAPVRGQRAFNTSLAPVDFSFSTYLRPEFNDAVGQQNVICEESVLWNALASDKAIGAVGAGWTTGNPSTLTFLNSNVHQLQKFGMIFIVDQVAYAVDNCSLNQLTIDFGLDAIATGAWTGQGTTLRKLGDGISSTSAGVFTGTGVAGSHKLKSTDAKFITNKLSTVTLKTVKALTKVGGTSVAAAGAEYKVALTGGSITISNNITYITPANLGTVNLPAVYYTGQRSITGTINAYLKTGTTGDDSTSTGKLLADMLDAASTTIEPMFELSIAIGGSANKVKIVADVPSAVLSVPTVDVQQIVSTAINFTAQGSTGTGASTVYDLSAANDLKIKYYAEDTTNPATPTE
jgi:hypothetical protein